MRKDFFLILAIFCMSSTCLAQSWMNPRPWTNDLRLLTYCPTDTTLVYGVEYRTGNVWKSDDGGFQWSTCHEYRPGDGEIKKFVFHPVSPDTLFVLNDRLYKSCDSGDTWVITSLDAAIIPEEMYYSPHNYRECLLIAEELYRSMDGGTIWEEVGSCTEVQKLAYDASLEGHLVGWNGTSVLIESYDNGNTWSEYGENHYEFNCVETISIDEEDNSIVYVWGKRSDDGSYGWYRVLENGNVLEVTEVAEIAEEGTGRTIGDNLWTDGNKTFYGIKAGECPGNHSDNDWHLCRSTDGMDSWEMIALNFPTTDGEYGDIGEVVIAQNPQNDNIILVGTHNGAYRINLSTNEIELMKICAGVNTIYEITTNPMDSDGFYLVNGKYGLWSIRKEEENWKEDYKCAGRISKIRTWQNEEENLMMIGESIRRYDCNQNQSEVLVSKHITANYTSAICCPGNSQRLIYARVDWHGDPIRDNYLAVKTIGQNNTVRVLDATIASLCVDRDGNTIYAGGMGLYKSVDDGNTWELIDESFHYICEMVLMESERSIIINSNYSLVKYDIENNEREIIYVGCNVYDFVVRGDQIYIVIDEVIDDNVLCSNDAGVTWETLELPEWMEYYYHSPRSLCLSESGNYLAIGTESTGVWVLDITDNDVEEVISGELVQEMKVYPNPFNSSTTVTILSEMNGDVTMTLYNVLGEVVVKKGIAGKGSKQFVLSRESVDMARLSSGVYFLELTDGKKKHVKRIYMMK